MSTPTSVDAIFDDFINRRAGALKALTNGADTRRKRAAEGETERAGGRRGRGALAPAAPAARADRRTGRAAAAPRGSAEACPLRGAPTTADAPWPRGGHPLSRRDPRGAADARPDRRQSRAESEHFHEKCDPDAENLCLYGNADATWTVSLPAEMVPPELPEPTVGINFARDGMNNKNMWLALGASPARDARAPRRRRTQRR